MKNDIHPLRVLLKAAVLFIVINILFAWINPRLGKITFYNSILPGRLRFPYEGERVSNLASYNVSIFDDFDAMFGTHVISKEKAENEFRLILLGDSTTWGYGLSADETLSEQINQLHIQTCDGRNIHAYNLGYPYSFLTRDLLLLDKAMEYQPDMVLWLITLSTLEPKVAETKFIVPHAQQYLQLAHTYDLKLSHFSQPIETASLKDRTLISQRRHLKNIVLTQAFGVLWGATRIDHAESQRLEPGLPTPDVENDWHYEELSPGEESGLFQSLLMDVVSTAFNVAGNVPVVLVNEPIFIAKGQNHTIRYNGFYPRWIYDEYRQFISQWTTEHDHPFLDYWDAIPPEEFSDAYFHRRVSGERHFAELLAPQIQKLVCPP